MHILIYLYKTLILKTIILKAVHKYIRIYLYTYTKPPVNLGNLHLNFAVQSFEFFQYFQIFSNVSHHFSNIFKRFQTFSNIFKHNLRIWLRFYLTWSAQSLQTNPQSSLPAAGQLRRRYRMSVARCRLGKILDSFGS